MRSKNNNFKKLWPYLKECKAKVFLILLLGIIQVFVSVILPIIDAQIIIKLTNNMIEQFILMAICYMSVVFIGDIVDYFAQVIYAKIELTVSLKLRHKLGQEVLKLDNKSLDENSSGVFIQRLMADSSNMSLVFERATNYIMSILTNIGIFLSVFIINKIILLYVFFIVFIRFIIERIRLSTKKKNKKELKTMTDSVTGFASEMIRGAKDIKMLNAEDSFIDSFYDRFSKLNDKNKKMRFIDLKLLLMRWEWSGISHFGLLILMAVLILHNQLEIPYALIIFNYSGRWNSFANNITNFIELLNDFDISATRIFEIIEDKFTKETFGSIHLKKVNGDFEFKNVSFSFDNNQVLNRLSFKVNANETVAFVGKSGAGKTTIFNLLCKMYDNYDGTILIDGNDIQTLDKDSIRGNITIVSQNPYIFNLSVRDNLKLVCKNLTNKQMKEACKMACLDEFIESLPNKYDTILGEGGVTLSGGQKQRLAIARAFVQKTEIILFDEATSALDNKTQMEIAKAINNLKKDYTILIIAHRLSTIKNADRILFIENGKVLMEGSHEYLLKNCKSYKDLYDAEIEK